MKNLAIFILFSLCFTTTFAQVVPGKDEKNNGSSDTVLAGNVLPEAFITDEYFIRTLEGDENPARAEDFQATQFKAYAIKAEKEIAENEKNIVLIRQQLKKERGRKAIKHWRELAVLEIENEQLKDELWTYLHYGAGDWIQFCKEFNDELRPLAQDLVRLKEELF